MDTTARMYNDLESILLTRDQIHEAVKKLGEQITQDYAGKSPVLIGILKGAIVFYSDLMREIDLPVINDFMAISSYGKSTKTSGVVRILKDLSMDITGHDVIVVEDIVDSGRTLSHLKKILEARNAESIAIATLLDKPARREVDLEVKYTCFEIPDTFAVGYGLDYAEKYRNLPDIGALKREIYEKKK